MKYKTLVVIPTYNEKENIADLIGRIRTLSVPTDILVVDDSSPDGTCKIVEEIAKNDGGVFILCRKTKEGLGRAYVAGFTWAIDKGYNKIFSMDADFSHAPEALAKMIEISRPDTVVIGSRYVRGGKIVGWTINRYFNSWCANWVTRSLLFIKVKDATAGFKCYPIEFLNKIDLSKIQASGYAFQVEMLLLAQDNGFKLVETPITFTDRTAGKSKIQGELKKSAQIVLKLAWARPLTREFIKFVIVGAINTLLDWSVFYPLKAVFIGISLWGNPQFAKLTAKTISFTVSASSSYYMNRRWTFRSENSQMGKEWTKFFIVSFGGLLINLAIFDLVTTMWGMRDILGLFFATCVGTLWNFILNKKWTFKK